MTPTHRRSFFMKQLLWVGIGGFLGSIARYKLGGFVFHRSETWNFPLSTFTVNLLGCFVIGGLAGRVERHDLFPPPRGSFSSPGYSEDSPRFRRLPTREPFWSVEVCSGQERSTRA